MSAVSAEFSHASASISSQPSGADGSDSQGKDARPGTVLTPSTDFGPNEWLVDELYQRYQADPGSVDRAWWNFFADYRPEPAAASPDLGSSARPAASAPSAPASSADLVK